MSTHFITEEYEHIYIPLFQSCVLNYLNKMLEFFSRDVTERIPANFLNLSVKLANPSEEEIQARYPKQIAERLLHSQRMVAELIPAIGNPKYAVMIRHDYYLTKRADLATACISIAKSAEQAAFIIKEAKDMQNVSPYTRKQC